MNLARRCVTGALPFLLLLSLAQPGYSQEEFFIAGNQAYQSGDYETALEQYRRVVDAGFESGALFYNIGNTYFKLGDLGRSILNYERAARLEPGSDDIRANLELARTLTADEITPLPRFWGLRLVEWWVGLLPLWLLRLLVGGCYVAALTALAWVTLARTERKRPLQAGALLAGTLAVVLGVNLLVRDLGIGAATEAIIMAPEVPVYSAPSEDSSLLVFNLHEGTLVRIDQVSNQWAEVVLRDGNVGWLRVEAVEEI